MKRGRPPIVRGDLSISVHFRLPTKHYDQSQAQANAARVPLSEWVRQVVTRACRQKRAGRRAG